MDVAEPPRIVFESSTLCADRDRADELLRKTLAAARAPTAGWNLTTRIRALGVSALWADGEITDADGLPVAHRALSGAGTECSGFARGVAIWASLVLEAQLKRAQAPRASVTGERAPAAHAEVSSPATGVAAHPPIAVTASSRPAVEERERPSPEQEWYLHHEGARTLELGVSGFLMSGAAGGAIAGPSAFLVVETGHGLFLRPSVAVGRSLTSLPPPSVKSSSWAATRMDACLRLPGLYKDRHGIQLDMCAGADLGFTYLEAGSGETLPYFDVGPSVEMRGELAGDLSAMLRGTGGVNVVREAYIDSSGAKQDPTLWSERLEVAFSWRLR